MTRLTQTIIRELLDYNPRTGLLVWKRRHRRWFKTDRAWNTWNARYAGKSALNCIDHFGYRHGSIFGTGYKAHRIIFLWMTGHWPNPETDHDNHKRDDNRWSNLYEKTHQQNQRNMSLPTNNKSGCIGVRFQNQKYIAEIRVNKRSIYLDTFPTFAGAVATRRAAERQHDFSSRHGR